MQAVPHKDIRLPSRNETDIENLLLPTGSGGFVHLKDIATVSKEEKETSDYYRINGKNAVNLYITAREGENKITLANKVKAIVDQTAKELPKGFEVRLEHDDAQTLIVEMYRDGKQIAISLSVLWIHPLFNGRHRSSFLVFSGSCIDRRRAGILICCVCCFAGIFMEKIVTLIYIYQWFHNFIRIPQIDQ